MDNNNSPKEKLILKIIREDEHHSHHCGHMLFDDNNYLNICVGDLHDPENPNDLSSLSGKILRINVLNQETYSIPSENPYVNNNKNIREEILFYGLRNPWKFSLYKNNFFIPDVGGDLWEELNVVENYNENTSSFKSFGWPFYEGIHKTNFSSEIKNLTSDDTVFPVLTYPHQFEEIIGCSITGGEVYNGNLSPDWIGTYIFSDLCSGKIWGLKKMNGEYKVQEIYDLDAQPVFIGGGVDNEILILTLNGELLKLNLPNFNNDFINPFVYFMEVIQEKQLEIITNTNERYENSTSWKIGNRIVNILKFFKIDKLFEQQSQSLRTP